MPPLSNSTPKTETFNLSKPSPPRQTKRIRENT